MDWFEAELSIIVSILITTLVSMHDIDMNNLWNCKNLQINVAKMSSRARFVCCSLQNS